LDEGRGDEAWLEELEEEIEEVVELEEGESELEKKEETMPLEASGEDAIWLTQPLSTKAAVNSRRESALFLFIAHYRNKF